MAVDPTLLLKGTCCTWIWWERGAVTARGCPEPSDCFLVVHCPLNLYFMLETIVFKCNSIFFTFCLPQIKSDTSLFSRLSWMNGSQSTESLFFTSVPPRDIWQCLEIFHLSQLEQRCYWLLVGRNQGSCSASYCAQDSPPLHVKELPSLKYQQCRHWEALS